MTDNVTLIIVAGIGGVPGTIAAMVAAMVARRQTTLQDAVHGQSQEAVSTKTEVLKVHDLVNSQMTKMRADLDAANARLADLIAKLPGRINGH